MAAMGHLHGCTLKLPLTMTVVWREKECFRFCIPQGMRNVLGDWRDGCKQAVGGDLSCQ